MAEPESREWKGRWVAQADHPERDLGIFVLRRRLSLEIVPSELLVRVSADQRYKLFVNDRLVSFGPQRGDLEHWFYETVDLAPHLVAGENVVWALVWNFGWMAPMAQMTLRTGFLCDSDLPQLCTPSGWGIARAPGWDYGRFSDSDLDFVGPDERVDGRMLPDWRELPAREDLGWTTPRVVRWAGSRGCPIEPYWALVPRSIPPMRYEVRESAPKVRVGTALDVGAPLLLDYGHLMCAYPRVALKGPAGTEVRLTYAEALWLPDGTKGNRDEVAGKKIRGNQDIVVLGEGATWFEPLWWRTYRYLQIEASGPVSVLSLDAVETGYPYTVESSFEADDPWVARLWEVSVRTAERCAAETYFDCPYYEQLQYVGDTRIQTLLHYYLSTDRALARNAVEQFGWSIMENGLTQSRYPNRTTQVIPPFSLWWVMMLWDQMRYDRIPPSTMVRQAYDMVRHWQELDEEASYWLFGDWVPTWRAGVPPGNKRSLMHDLTLLLARAVSSEMTIVHVGDHEEIGKDWARLSLDSGLAQEFIEANRVNLSAAIGSTSTASEHIEALWRCLQLQVGQLPDPWPTEALAKANAAKCTFYFSYYKHLAMFGRPEVEGGGDGSDRTDRIHQSNRSSVSDQTAQSAPPLHSLIPSPCTPDPTPQTRFDYLTELQPWKEMIESGLSTFAETPEPARSDCHAWSAHPALGFFQIVAGVTSIAPGWQKARIMPHPGSLRRFDARIAHPDGELRVAYENGRLEIDSPVPAQLHWQGKEQELPSGRHTIG